jgi:UDP-N-acetylglucosamine diphosphorylase/glucosamine-1-phosphate N-acetyltransferase
MNIILFDEPTTKKNLLPFTFTRPAADIRIGILTIREKWEHLIKANYSYLTDLYLAQKFPSITTSENLYVNGSILPNAFLAETILNLKNEQVLEKEGVIIAFRGKIDSLEELKNIGSRENEKISYSRQVKGIKYVYDIFINNGEEIRSDFTLLTKGRTCRSVTDPHTITYNPNDIFIEENVSIRAAVLNAENGPIYIGKNAVIGEGSVIRGATAIGADTVLNLGTRIRGDTTIGPYCKVGGEISNSVIFGYSSKAHDGYLGNSVIGEWCNLGADTNTSNLKNNYKNVKIWNYNAESLKDTERQFCGLMMADHSKCSINTMFNTGTVVGVSANIFGGGFPPSFIPSFSWGGADGMTTYHFQQALDVMPKVFERRKKQLTDEDVLILKHIFDETEKYRKRS